MHYALLQHPRPRRLLLIGGGLDGAIGQALRHPTLERVDYLELDPALIAVARKYFPSAWKPVESDPRVAVHLADGRLFLKGPGTLFDVIVVNLPEPRTAQLNRFYTLEFFRESARRLAPGGVFSFRLPSSENYIGAEQAELLGALRRTLGAVFPDVRLLPGDNVHFFASAARGALPDVPELLRRLRERRLGTLYVREAFIRFRTMPDRIRYLDEGLRPYSRGPLNRDFSPIAYYFGTALWAARFSTGYRSLFLALAQVPFPLVLSVLGLVLAAGVVAARRQPARAGALLSAAATGFTLLALQILILLGFQAVYGFVYRQLALLSAAFMTGMALGAWRGLRAKPGPRQLFSVQAAAAAAPLLVFATLQALAQTGASGIVSGSAVALLSAASGAIGGRQFAVASRVYFEAAPNSTRLGAVYGADLAGACVGALALAAWLVPLFGFAQTALAVSFVSLAAALAVFRLR